MSELTTFRDHCRAMATAEHRRECPWSQPENCKPKPRWGFVYDDNDEVRALGWLGMTEPPPACDGCVSDADRALFARLADEVDDHMDEGPTLWEDS